MEELMVYNSLTRKKEIFEPLVPGMVGVYVCGPTVYDNSHLGHAKSYISFDVIVRYLRYLGYKVKYVQNLTDVGHLLGDAEEGEDKIAKKARLEKLDPMQVVETYTRSYFEDMDLLGNERPDISPRASAHIIEQIEMIKVLLEKGLAYEVNGNVYYDVHKFNDYGKLSGRKLEELESGVRIEVAEDKKHPADFSLWKKATPDHIMRWISPWGEGYPGWHIECSSMSTKYLGETFDIHGGGLENIFPHHECEIAQSEGTYDKMFARYWLHNNMVTVDGVKMGKSMNNFITIKDALKKYDPMAIRLFILMSHYRSALDFSEKALHGATSGLMKLKTFFSRIDQLSKQAPDSSAAGTLPVQDYVSAFQQAMNDDFNTPQALATFYDFMNRINKTLDEGYKPGRKEFLALKEVLNGTVGGVLGIALATEKSSGTSTADLERIMQVLLEIRTTLRKEKNFSLADKIRDRLQEANITIQDTPEGPSWIKN
jgi:cysteinyl-tRNA synthetase